MLTKGLRLIFAVRRAASRSGAECAGCAREGGAASSVSPGTAGELAADHLFLHEGVIPNLQVSLALELRHEWDQSQLRWRPALDPWGQTSLANIAVAGDGGRIAGAEAAVLSGRLAALDAAARLGHSGEPERDRRAEPFRAALDRERALRPFSIASTVRPLRSSSRRRTKRSRAAARRCRSAAYGRPRSSARKVQTSSRRSPVAAWDPAQVGSAARSSPPSSPTRAANHADISAYRPRAPVQADHRRRPRHRRRHRGA